VVLGQHFERHHQWPGVVVAGWAEPAVFAQHQRHALQPTRASAASEAVG